VTLERRRGLSAPGVAALALMAAAAVACGDGSLGPAPDAGPLDAGPCGSPRSGPAAGRLVCPAPVTVPCAGVRTPAPVDGVTDVTLAEDACGDDEVVSTVSTLPAAGLRPGTTPVEVTAVTRRGGLLSCETEVRVVDEAPPVLTCPAGTLRQALATPDQPVAVVPPERVFDRCDPAPTLASDVEDGADPRRPRIVHRATDAAGQVGECTVDVELLRAFPAPRFRVMGGRLRDDEGTDVFLAWEDPGGEATDLALERAADPDGPFTRLEVLPGEQRTYVDQNIPGPRAHYRLVTIADGLEGGVTPVVTAHAIAGETYDVRDVDVAGVPFPTTLYGVTRAPVLLDPGAHPLVLLLHGNHGNCRESPDAERDVCSRNEDHVCPFDGFVTTPNAEGLGWLAESLAVQGRVAVSVSGNAMNCRSNFNPERAALLVGHLRRWVTWATAAGGADPFGDRFVGKLDLERVGLFGHSRGGEGVALVPGRLADDPVPGVEVRSVFALAPVDFENPAVPGTPYAVLLPTCDGDVWTLEGMHVYDRTLPQGGGAPLVQVVFDGAIHNFFNTEWFFDDSFSRASRCAAPTRVSGPTHRAALEAVVGDWLAATLDAPPAKGPGDPGLAGWLRAEAGVPTSVNAWAGAPVDLRRSHAAGGTILVDDFGGAGAPDENLLGEANRVDGLAGSEVCPPFGCGSRYRHLRPALSARWDEASTMAADPAVAFTLDDRDTTEVAWVAFRVASRDVPLNAGRAFQELRLVLVDADGAAAGVDLGELPTTQPIPHLYPATSPFELLQTVRVPVAAFEGIDPTRLSGVEVTPTAPTGALLITDVALEPRSP